MGFFQTVNRKDATRMGLVGAVFTHGASLGREAPFLWAETGRSLDCAHTPARSRRHEPVVVAVGKRFAAPGCRH